MLEQQSQQLVIAISSRALLDLTDSHHVYEEQGVDAYCHYQIAHEDTPLKPGIAFNLVRKLFQLNSLNPEQPVVEVILVSRNSADKDPFLKAFDADIFFDDQRKDFESARQHVATRHLPSGVKNKI